MRSRPEHTAITRVRRGLALAGLCAAVSAALVLPAASHATFPPTVMAVVYEPDYCWDGPDHLFAANSWRSWEVRLHDPTSVDHIFPAPSGDRVAYDGVDNALYLQRMAGGQPLGAAIRLSGRNWRFVYWAPDGRRLLATREGSLSETLWLVDAQTGRQTQLPVPAGFYVFGAAVPATGFPVVAFRNQKRGVIARVAPGRRHFVASVRSEESQLAISANGRRLAVHDGWSNPVEVFDLSGRKARHSLVPPRGTYATSFEWIRHGRELVISYGSGQASGRSGVMLAGSTTGTRVLRGVRLLDATEAGLLASTASDDRHHDTIDVRGASGGVIGRLHLETPVGSATWIDSRWLAITSEKDDLLRVADTFNGSVVRLRALPLNDFDDPSISPVSAHAADC